MPVPPKAVIYPEKILPDVDLHGETAAPYLARFYDELRKREIDVVDPSQSSSKTVPTSTARFFCKTDTHWSGLGLCSRGTNDQRKNSRGNSPASREKITQPNGKRSTIKGDLGDLAGLMQRSLSRKNRGPNDQRQGNRRSNKSGSNSPLLIIGDSHTLVFHDFLAEKSGLLDQVAYEIGFAPDLIGTRGSGATSVRVSLYRRAKKDPEYLAKKKIIVWCFAAREFTESDPRLDKCLWVSEGNANLQRKAASHRGNCVKHCYSFSCSKHSGSV